MQARTDDIDNVSIVELRDESAERAFGGIGEPPDLGVPVTACNDIRASLAQWCTERGNSR